MFGHTKKRKIFCIGQNKTGTTSLERALGYLGYELGDQETGELLFHDWRRRDFRSIIEFCRTADVFQDAPFSHPFTFGALDQAFPGSKFILSVRTDADEWFDSLVRFHSKIVGRDRVPTKQDLMEHEYCYRGYLWDVHSAKYGVDAETLYQRERYVDHDNRHNELVMRYFAHRSEDLLVLNVGEEHAMEKLCEFLGRPYFGESMPHLNASS